MVEHQKILDFLQKISSTVSNAESFLVDVATFLQRERPYYNWVGIYLLQGQELVLGPYVGKPTPHTRIPLNKGICGAAASTGRTIVVDDVNRDPRYLACSLETRSEIVVPVRRGQRILGEIDIDSNQPAAFSDDDRKLLEAVAQIVAARL